MNENIYERSLIVHEELKGKLGVYSKVHINDVHSLSVAYTPGVAEPCRRIAKNQEEVWRYTMRSNTVAVVTDGSAVLGLGNIGPYAALPVMEGKAVLFREFAEIDSWPICLDTQDTEEIIKAIRYLAPVFGGINLEDIASPRCFEIEDRLQDLGIPVFHDDQHGTAVVLLAALLNASKVVGKNFFDLRVVINGAGAAGIAIAKLLSCQDQESDCVAVKDIILCDTQGVIHKNRKDLNEVKKNLLTFTNKNNIEGNLLDAMKGANVFIGVSQANLLTEQHIRTMAKDPIIFALANPVPEIMPDKAKEYGAAVVGTGRSDFPNQINNVLAFPGIFRGALDVRAKRITNKMKLEAARALARTVTEVTPDKVVPSPFERSAAYAVAEAVRKAYQP